MDFKQRLLCSTIDPFAALRLQRGVEHLAQLGPRAIAEFLVELAGQIGGLPATLALLADRRKAPDTGDAAVDRR